MPRLTAFVVMSLNGFYVGEDDDFGWHRHGEEELAFSRAQVARGHTLLFGRRTHDMMAAFWPTSDAVSAMPEIAHAMNTSRKIVFSRTITDSPWSNTQVIRGEAADAVARLKAGDGAEMTLLGSGRLVAPLAAQGLIDEYQIMLDPVALGAGGQLFQGLPAPLELTLVDSRAHRSGVLLLTYRRREG